MFISKQSVTSLLLAILAGSVVADVQSGINPDTAQKFMTDKASHSWEWGTAAEALLELYDNQYSVFGSNPFPNGKVPKPDPSIYSLSYAKPHIDTNSQVLVPNSAVGDPASLGVSAILIGQSDSKYQAAADRQADYILNKAPRYSNGAISHRPDVAECWADNMFMSFPFLAYQAVAKNDRNLMATVVKQCGLQRDVLKREYLNWRHIVGPQSEDDGLWSTGNGWAALGMVRVLHTLQKWSGSASMTSEATSLKTWIKEILDGAMLSGRDDLGLFHNYLNDAGWFGEISGTAALTAAAYRMAVNDPSMFGSKYIAWADTNRKALSHQQGGDGNLVPAVNPYSWQDRNKYYNGSPEGQAFAVMVHASFRDCVNAGKCQQ